METKDERNKNQTKRTHIAVLFSAIRSKYSICSLYLFSYQVFFLFSFVDKLDGNGSCWIDTHKYGEVSNRNHVNLLYQRIAEANGISSKLHLNRIHDLISMPKVDCWIFSRYFYFWSIAHVWTIEFSAFCFRQTAIFGSRLHDIQFFCFHEKYILFYWLLPEDIWHIDIIWDSYC